MGYNDITVKAPSHYAKPTRTFRTDGKIEFKDTGIVFAAGGHKYAVEYDKIISIEPAKEHDNRPEFCDLEDCRNCRNRKKCLEYMGA